MIARGSRGQALIEMAIALPVFLLAMFGVVWALQTGVLGERIQLVARYGGMVSAQINPYQQYSLYAMYSAAANNAAPVACTAPPSDLLANAGPLASPAPTAPPFWQPTTGSTQSSTTCTRTYSTAAGLTTPKVFGSANVTVAATNDVPGFLQPFVGKTMPWSATMNQMRSPDMAALAACYPDLAADDFIAQHVVFHSRFSTNTLPAWERAQPFRRPGAELFELSTALWTAQS